MADMFLDLSKILIASFVISPLLSKAVNYPLVTVGVLCSIITWMIGIHASKPLGG